LAYITLEWMTGYDGLIKDYIDSEKTKSLKSVELRGSSLCFFADPAPAADAVPDYQIDLPEDTAAAIKAELDAHVADTVAHVTADERTAWNAKAETADVEAVDTKVDDHIADDVAHITAEERDKWNAGYDDTALADRVTANEEAITKLNADSSTEGSVDYKIAQMLVTIMDNPDDAMNSINELVTWVNDHAADALELSNKVIANEADIAALEALVGTEGVAQQIADAIAAALTIDGVDKYALATDLTAAIARIAAIEVDYLTSTDKDEILAEVDTKIADRVGDIPDTTTIKDYVDTAVGTGGTDAADAIATAKQEAIDAAATHTDEQVGFVSDRIQAIEDDYLKGADKTEITDSLAAHTGDTDIHITADERAAWDAKAETADVEALDTKVGDHIADADSHVTAEKKAEWDAKATEEFVAEKIAEAQLDGQVDLTTYIQRTEFEGHTKDADIHITAEERAKWDAASGGDASTVNGHTVESDVPADAVFTDTVYDDTALAGRVQTIEDDYLKSADKSEITDSISAHTADADIHVTADDKTAWNDKQDKIVGTQGQVVGFDENGAPVAQDAPETGVTTFNGRTGAVVPTAGDYTADMVGADPVGSAAAALAEAKTHTNDQIANLVGTAPEILDTIEEVAQAIQENETVVDALEAAVGSKQDKLTGTEGQIVGFDADGKAVAQDAPVVDAEPIEDSTNAVQSGGVFTKLKEQSGALDTHTADTDIHTTADEKAAWTAKTDSRDITQAEYDALPIAEQMNGTTYYITDSENEQGSGSGVPDGGTTGQVLTKVSDADGDATWLDPSSEMVEMTQAEYDLLSDEEKNDGTVRYINDGVLGLKLPSGSLFSMTQAEYDALSDEEKSDNNIRMITDVNGGGGGVHFSTDELEIGTWMGKPLYQITKTVTGRTKVAGYYTAEHGIANVETIFVNPFGTFRLSSGGNYGLTPYLAWNNEVASGFISGVRYVNATVINFVEGKDDSSAHTWYVTLCYTKTTD